MVKRVLMVAFHFPPLRGSSGIQRALKFAQYLPALGWQPLVLSAHPRAYANQGPDQLAEIAPEAVVKRAFALDSGRHLAWRGRYFGWTALPDRFAGWVLGAVPAGLSLVRNYRPQVIWSTYPVASATLIGLLLHKLTGLPWIADLRDPMTDDHYPRDPRVRAVALWIERRTVRNAALVVCTTPGAVATYTRRYPELPRSRFAVLENGYDEENFRNAGNAAAPRAPGQPFTLIHSGIIYPSERDPVPLFRALAELKAAGAIDASQLRIVLRATAHDDYVGALLAEHGIADLVSLAPHIAYQAALAEMLAADGLLVLQASNCNHQIPAKLYEYLRAGRPILALTDSAGDTAATLRAAGVDTIAALDESEDIKRGLLHFLQLARNGQAPLPAPAAVAAASRQARTVQLARILDAVTVTAPLATDLTEEA
ncbi:glycosyltransferase [Pseudoduganella eburnea]|uniref:Glycosyltransferase n=1 Tax=Massilia eburnea TaxID=1776165 RepID=A0A6L6QQ31_9BURK|nr:glycosyltransferase [Massilia eburnea]MTW14285.1 glycosyltransferase [Massilia eburnea]